MKTANHLFQHLGKTPYRLIGTDEGSYTCDYCGTYIVNQFHCEGSDGKRFVLGSSCIEKLGDKGLVNQVKEAIRVKRQQKRHAEQAVRAEAYMEQRRKEVAEETAKRAAKIEHIKAELNRVLPVLKETPHPNGYFASKGKTMLDYLEYFRADVFKPIEEQSDDWYYYNSKLHFVLREVGIDV